MPAINTIRTRGYALQLPADLLTLAKKSIDDNATHYAFAHAIESGLYSQLNAMICAGIEPTGGNKTYTLADTVKLYDTE